MTIEPKFDVKSKESQLRHPLHSFRINKRDSLPMYLQIANKIQAAIEEKSIAPGTLLPPAQVLSEQFGVSKMTLRQAYSVLERKGYLEARRGIGTYALDGRIEKKIAGMLSFSEEVSARGGMPSSKVLNIRTVTPTHGAQAFLGLQGGETVYELKRLRLSNGRPLAIEIVQVPEKLFPGFDQLDWKKESLYRVMEETYGFTLSHCLSEIVATSATHEQMQLLNIESGSPLLVINRKSYMKDDIPVEFSITCYPGDCYIATFSALRST